MFLRAKFVTDVGTCTNDVCVGYLLWLGRLASWVHLHGCTVPETGCLQDRIGCLQDRTTRLAHDIVIVTTP